MTEEVGIKEFREVLHAANVLSLDLISRLKDGAGLDDIAGFVGRLVGDEAFRANLTEAAEGVSKIPAEIKDLSLVEAGDLIKLQVDYLPQLMAALGK